MRLAELEGQERAIALMYVPAGLPVQRAENAVKNTSAPATGVRVRSSKSEPEIAGERSEEYGQILRYPPGIGTPKTNAATTKSTKTLPIMPSIFMALKVG